MNHIEPLASDWPHPFDIRLTHGRVNTDGRQLERVTVRAVVLRGDLQMDDLDIRAGDYHEAPAGSRHGRVSSTGGALIYLRGVSLGVGAGENYDNASGTDGCGVTNGQADNAQDIVSFSSRGPCQDGRVKPDIVAPGTHIHGAASYAPGYDGSGVCDRYSPAGQTKYASSSGTSHSTPSSLTPRWTSTTN